MSEQTAATPETGTVSDRASPGARRPVIKDEASAVSAIASMLDPAPVKEKGTRQKQPPADEATRDDAGDGDEEELRTESPESDEGEGEAETGQDATTEADDADLELPPSIAELTEALGVAPEKLMGIKVPVTVDGKASEVTLEEAIRGYQREADYTRKTQAYAQERQQFEAQMGQAQAAFQQRAHAVDTMIAALQAELEAGPKKGDLDYLINENPAEYIRQNRLLEERHMRLAQFQRERGMQLQQQQQEQMQKIGEYRRSQQQALLQHYPGIDNPEKGQAIQARTMKVLKEFGYSEEEVKAYMSGPWDHRLIRVALKLDEMTQLQAKGKEAAKKVALKPKLMKPGTSTAKKGDGERTEELRARLRRHGKSRARHSPAAEKDAVAYVRRLLD